MEVLRALRVMGLGGQGHKHSVIFSEKKPCALYR